MGAGDSVDQAFERWASRTLGAVTALTLFTMMMLTFVEARDEHESAREAYLELNIPKYDRFRVSVQQE